MQLFLSLVVFMVFIMEEEVTLSNGSVEPKAVVLATMTSLSLLWNKGLQGIMVVYDLHQLCQNPSYFTMNLNMLQKISLVQKDGKVNSIVQNVVLSAIKGEGLSISLGSPYAD